MKSMIRSTMVAAVFALAAVSQAASWGLDPAHSMISFNAKHMMLSTVRGDFTAFEGTVIFDENNPSTFSVEATADAATVNTRNEKRDEHLRSADFFEAEKHPHLTLKSKKVEKVSDGRYKMLADLTIRGVTREVEFDVTGFNGTMTDPWGSTRTSALATATINREDFGLMWNKTLDSGGVLVSKDINIMIDVQLVKKDQG